MSSTLYWRRLSAIILCTTSMSVLCGCKKKKEKNTLGNVYYTSALYAALWCSFFHAWLCVIIDILMVFVESFKKSGRLPLERWLNLNWVYKTSSSGDVSGYCGCASCNHTCAHKYTLAEHHIHFWCGIWDCFSICNFGHMSCTSTAWYHSHVETQFDPLCAHQWHWYRWMEATNSILHWSYYCSVNLSMSFVKPCLDRGPPEHTTKRSF